MCGEWPPAAPAHRPTLVGSELYSEQQIQALRFLELSGILLSTALGPRFIEFVAMKTEGWKDDCIYIIVWRCRSFLSINLILCQDFAKIQKIVLHEMREELSKDEFFLTNKARDILMIYKKIIIGACEMAQWIRPLATPPEGPGSIPSTHRAIPCIHTADHDHL